MKSVVFVIIICSVFLFSCEGDMDIHYHFTGLDLENARNTGDQPEVTSEDSIPKEAYVIRMNLFPEESLRDGRYVDSETPPRNTNPIDSIFVFSDNKMNDTLPAGSLLNNLFLIYNNNYLNTSDLDRLYITNVFSEDYYDQPYPKYVDLLLMFPPDSVRVQKFYVRIKLFDGTEFFDSTSSVKLY